MKKKFLFLAICTFLFLEIISASESNDSKSKISQKTAQLIANSALHAYNHKYKKAKNHKAFVQSNTGVWAWKANITTAEFAIQTALIVCQLHNKKSEDKYPCKVLNVDGKWVR